MSTIHIKQSTGVPPERFIAALTNFGPGRGKIFAHSHEDSVKVNARGDTWADVTEGSAGGFWERLRYDWSQPNMLRLNNTDSNAWSTQSNWVYTLTPRNDGGMDIDLVAVRKGRNAKGRLGAAPHSWPWLVNGSSGPIFARASKHSSGASSLVEHGVRAS